MNMDVIKALVNDVYNATDEMDRQEKLIQLGLKAKNLIQYDIDINASKGQLFNLASINLEVNKASALESILDFKIEYSGSNPEILRKIGDLVEEVQEIDEELGLSTSLIADYNLKKQYDFIQNQIIEAEKDPNVDVMDINKLYNDRNSCLVQMGENYIDLISNAGGLVNRIGKFVNLYAKVANLILNELVNLYQEYFNELNDALRYLENANGQYVVAEEGLRSRLSPRPSFLAYYREGIQIYNSSLLDAVEDKQIKQNLTGVFDEVKNQKKLVNNLVSTINRKLELYANDKLKNESIENHILYSVDKGLLEVKESQLKSTQSTTQRYDPLVVDLGSEGFNMKSMTDGVFFDPDMNQTREKNSWVGKDDALLAIDLDANGRIDNGAELFGDHFKMPDDSYATSSIHALSSLDSNKDGEIDSVLFRIIGITDFCKEHIGQFLC